MNTPLIISVQEARKILGKIAEPLSDDQVIQIILNLTDIATYVLEDKEFQ
jgi:hypothetical protein